MYWKNAYLTLALSICILAACSNEHDASPSSESSGAAGDDASVDKLPTALAFLKSRRVFEPQVTILRDDALVLTWRERGASGSNIYASVRQSDGRFAPPVRVNDTEDTVESFAHDGMRAAIAVGADHTIAIAWSDSRAQIRTAISADNGKTFAPSFRLDQAKEPAYRGFPAISFDPNDALHAIWIDSRFAEGFAEEPADLFYSQVVGGTVTEKNLTAQQEPSICGCCRTFINVDSGEVKLTFRNTTADGYRDPFVISGTLDGEFSEPQPVSDPLWELNGCPMAGPVRVGDEVLWHDGSTGKKLVMAASVDARVAQRVFDEDERGDWIGRQPPRAISVSDGKTTVLLIPGQPASRLIARYDNSWQTISDDLPSWATSGAYESGNLVLVGSVGGDFHIHEREVSKNLQTYF
jgi:hypothetical protein